MIRMIRKYYNCTYAAFFIESKTLSFHHFQALNDNNDIKLTSSVLYFQQGRCQERDRLGSCPFLEIQKI